MFGSIRYNGRIYSEYKVVNGDIHLLSDDEIVHWDEVELSTLQVDCNCSEVFENDILYNEEYNEVIRVYFDTEDLAFKIESPTVIGDEVYWERQPIADSLGDYNFESDGYEVVSHAYEYSPHVHRMLTNM